MVSEQVVRTIFRKVVPLARPDLERLVGVLEPLAVSSATSRSMSRTTASPFLSAVRHEPARALRQESPREEDAEPEDRAEPEGEPPADVDREERRVQEENREALAGGGADHQEPLIGCRPTREPARESARRSQS